MVFIIFKCKFDTMKQLTQIHQITKEKFDSFDLIRMKSDKAELAFIPEFGGNIVELNMLVNGEKTNILDSYYSAEELIQFDYYKSALLLPFPNRLKNGQYQFDGKTYQFPINNAETGNALHGFKDFYKMEVTSIDENNCSVTLKSQYLGNNSSYPFPFDLEIQYQLDEYNGFVCQVSLTNPNDTAIPIGFGWHPYFQFGNSVEKIALTLPKVDQIEIDDTMIPTGKETEFTVFSSSQFINDTELDTCFKIKENYGTALIELAIPDQNTRMTYWQEADKFPYFQLFTPPSRKSLAIEPMTCNIDAFNNKEGLLRLESEERFTGKFGIKISSL